MSSSGWKICSSRSLLFRVSLFLSFFFFGFFFVRSLGTWCPVPTCPDRDRVLFCFSSKGTCAAAAAAGAARICASLDFILFFSIYPTGSRYVIKKNNNK